MVVEVARKEGDNLGREFFQSLELVELMTEKWKQDF